jgi:hypothetical protein
MIRRVRRYLRSEAGIAPAALLIILANTIMVLIAVWSSGVLDDAETKQLRDCLQQAKQAIVGIKAALEDDPDIKFTIDDPNVIVALGCQALAEQLKKHPELEGKAGAIEALVASIMSNIDTCALQEPTKQDVVVAGRDYTIPVAARIPVGSFSSDFAVQATISGGGSRRPRSS